MAVHMRGSLMLPVRYIFVYMMPIAPAGSLEGPGGGGRAQPVSDVGEFIF